MNDEKTDNWQPKPKDKLFIRESISNVEAAMGLGDAFTDIQSSLLKGEITPADYVELNGSISRAAAFLTYKQTQARRDSVEIQQLLSIGSQARDTASRMLETLVARGELPQGVVKPKS